VLKNFFAALLLAPMIASTVAAQTFIGETINAAFETVQEGLDLIWPDKLSLEDVNARVGFGFGTTPDYRGSDDYRLRLIPLIDIRYKDAWRLNGSLLTFTAYRAGNFEIGPLVNWRPGRSEIRNPALFGLGDINSTIEIGAFIRYKSKTNLFTLDYRSGLGENIRSSVRLTAGQGIFKKDNFLAMLGARAKWLSGRTMQTQFGISDTQAANSAAGLPAFATNSGFSEASINLVGAYRMNEKIRLLTIVSYGRLFGSAKASPLATGDIGSSGQLIAGTGLVFSF
jgi:MipA family protein